MPSALCCLIANGIFPRRQEVLVHHSKHPFSTEAEGEAAETSFKLVQVRTGKVAVQFASIPPLPYHIRRLRPLRVQHRDKLFVHLLVVLPISCVSTFIEFAKKA